MNDHRLAATLATEAGRLLLAVRTEFADATAEERKTAGDQRSHDFLMEQLAAARPDDAVLSEEGADDEFAGLPQRDVHGPVIAIEFGELAGAVERVDDPDAV